MRRVPYLLLMLLPATIFSGRPLARCNLTMDKHCERNAKYNMLGAASRAGAAGNARIVCTVCIVCTACSAYTARTACTACTACAAHTVRCFAWRPFICFRFTRCSWLSWARLVLSRPTKEHRVCELASMSPLAAVYL